METLLRDEERRLKYQEHGRKFHVNDSKWNTGEKLLLNACWKGQYELAKFFLKEKQADPNLESDRLTGVRPIHAAARAGHEDIVTLLLSSGADMFAKDGSGDTALHWASRNARSSVIHLLLSLNPTRSGEEDLNTLRNAYAYRDMMLRSENDRGKNASDVCTSGKIKELLERESRILDATIEKIEGRIRRRKLVMGR